MKNLSASKKVDMIQKINILISISMKRHKKIATAYIILIWKKGIIDMDMKNATETSVIHYHVLTSNKQCIFLKYTGTEWFQIPNSDHKKKSCLIAYGSWF